MLDDPEEIKRYDKSDSLSVIKGQPTALKTALALDGSLPTVKVENIILAGMGASALAGLIARNWLEDELKVPFVITRGYELPGFVNSDTLVIVSSYSGNTEETLAALADAKATGARIVILASGGELINRAEAGHYPHFMLPKGFQPRMAVWYSLRALAQIFDTLELTDGAVGELTSTAPSLEKAAGSWSADVPDSKNQAKQIAEQLAGNAVIVYAGPALSAAAYKWKINLNETGKNLAWSNEYSEWNHNEIVGWTGRQDKQQFKIVELVSPLDHSRIRKRFSAMVEILKGSRPEPITIKAGGGNLLEQLLWTVLLGDFVSVYVAVLNKTDPTPVEAIESLKRNLAD